MKLITSVVLTTVVLSSCVSSKKYNASIDTQEELRKENIVLNGRLQLLNGRLDSAMSSADLQLTLTEAKLEAKKRELEMREKRLAELEDLVKDQREAVQLLHQEVCSALKCFTPEELTVEVRDGKLYVSMSDKLLFESGSDQLNERGDEAIAMLADVLRNSDLEVMVEGHTDSIPINSQRNKDNWDLSVHRATSVTRIMIANGIAADRIIACGRGEFQPVAANDDAEGRALNRRTEIVLAPKLDKLWELAEQENEPTAENAQ